VSGQGSPDDRLSNADQTARLSRFKELLKLRSSNVSRFDANPEMNREFNELRVAFGVAAKRV
jgi:hypothetical protein